MRVSRATLAGDTVQPFSEVLQGIREIGPLDAPQVFQIAKARKVEGVFQSSAEIAADKLDRYVQGLRRRQADHLCRGGDVYREVALQGRVAAVERENAGSRLRTERGDALAF